MTTTSVAEKLDYTKPPPGYTLVRNVDGFMFLDSAGKRHASAMHNLGGDWREDFALARAWAHYKREHDPPGMQVFVWPKEKASDPPTAWCASLRGKVHFAAFEGDEGDTEARAACWAWHDRRHALAARLHDGVWCPECHSDDAHVVALDAKTSSQPWCTECDVEMGGLFEDVWPRCLGWTDEQAVAVEQWLQEPAAPMPSVLAEDDDAGDVDPICSRCGEACTWNESADRDDPEMLCNPCAQAVASEVQALRQEMARDEAAIADAAKTIEWLQNEHEEARQLAATLDARLQDALVDAGSDLGTMRTRLAAALGGLEQANTALAALAAAADEAIGLLNSSLVSRDNIERAEQVLRRVRGAPER